MSLFYEEYGPSTAPTIVFLHGGGVSGWMWRPQIDHFKEDYHCLVPDLPEQGKSTDGTPFSIQNSAEQIAELIKNHAHDGKAHVVGLSAGAQVVVALLHHTPECVDRADAGVFLPRIEIGCRKQFVSRCNVRRLADDDVFLTARSYASKVSIGIEV